VDNYISNFFFIGADQVPLNIDLGRQGLGFACIKALVFFSYCFLSLNKSHGSKIKKGIGEVDPQLLLRDKEKIRKEPGVVWSEKTPHPAT